jgi:radical SAM superfamily enzyme
MWSLKKWEVLNGFDTQLKRRGTYQGIYANGKKGTKVYA